MDKRSYYCLTRGGSAMNSVTIGIDLGDKNHQITVLDAHGQIIKNHTINNTEKSIGDFFKQYKEPVVAIEAGTHSPWISRYLKLLGCKVFVSNPRKMRSIWHSNEKCDSKDSEMLARIARFDSKLLYPITHRAEQSQIDLDLLQSRDILVKSRTKLINHVRGSVKSIGEQLPKCDTSRFHSQAKNQLPDSLKETLTPLIDIIEEISLKISEFDYRIENISQESYPETELLRKIQGVGPLTALAFVLIIGNPSRFNNSRQVGKFLGLTPKRDQSGETDKQLRTTKAGNPYLRRLLVGAANYVLGPFGPDCNLQRFGLRIAARGGKTAKKRAVVAVARKLAVLLHRIWLHGEIYDPFFKKNNPLQTKVTCR